MLTAAGLPENLLIADDATKAKLMANTQSAADHGAFGLPSFLVGDELYFGKDKLGEVERAIAEH